jgi:plastocyanin
MAIAAVGLVAVAGCGEKRETSTGAGSAAGSAPASAAAISETEFKLTPSSASISKAGSVQITVRNDGGTTHALDIVTPNGDVTTKPLAPGQSASLKATLKAGTYKMFCPIDGHRAKGMNGTIKVAGGGSGGSGSSGGGSKPAGGRSYGGGY